jgi:hypothetical protein
MHVSYIALHAINALDHADRSDGRQPDRDPEQKPEAQRPRGKIR